MGKDCLIRQSFLFFAKINQKNLLIEKIVVPLPPNYEQIIV